MGPVQGNNTLPTDNSMMPNQMNYMNTMTPTSEQGYQTFLCGLCCESACQLVWPIVYGLYLFEAIGKKEEPDYDCYANKYDMMALPGIMDIPMDESNWINVSY